MAINPDKLKVVSNHSRKEVCLSIARLPNSGRAFVGTSDFRIYEVDLSASKFEFRELGKHDSYVTSLALSGTTLISGGYDGQLRWWNTENRTAIRSLDAHKKWIRALAVSPDGRTLASVADDMVCRLWEAGSGKLLHELRGHAEKTPNHFVSMLHAVTFAPDGKHLATGDKIGKAILWDVSSGKQVASVEAPVMYTWDPVQRVHSIGGIRSLIFSPDSRHLAIGGMGKVGNIDHLGGRARVEVFDWQTGKRLNEFADLGVNGVVTHLEYTPDGSLLLGAGGDNGGYVFFLDPKTRKTVKLEKLPTHVHDIASDRNLESLFAARHGGLSVLSVKG